MYKYRRLIIGFLIVCCFLGGFGSGFGGCYRAQAQLVVPPGAADSVRLVEVGRKLADLSERDATYLEEVDISVGRMPLSDMLRNIAKVSRVSLSVKGAENMMVTCNFSRARITDLLFFLCKQYNLDIDVVGNIVSISPVPVPPAEVRPPNISRRIAGNKLSYDLGGDRLLDVVKRITALTGVNFVMDQKLYGRQISGFVEDMPFDDAVTALMAINGLETDKISPGTWEVIALPDNQTGDAIRRSPPQYTRKAVFSANELSVDSLGMITARIGRGNIRDIITDLCEAQELNYFFLTPVDQQTSVYIRGVDFEGLLAVLLSGTQYSYYRENGIYIFGTSSRDNSLTSARVIELDYRSVTKLEEMIPESLKTGVQVKPFPDLNAIVASGDQRNVARVEAFVRSIDKRVPLVTIEVIIVDATKNNVKEAGITMGLGEAPANTSGTLSPGIGLTLGSSSVNKLINSFNGFGSVNLGRVSSDFYMGLKFLEENGVITLRSTPKLSTLNGHEATLKSGETQYYKEVTNTWMGSQNPIKDETYIWKSVDANLSIKIIPLVSQDGHITLDIEIEQSEFVPRKDTESPPGTTTRSFKSLIRVQNEEMVLLGGIDRNLHEKTSKGLPLIARIPVLKWLFGSTTNNKEEHKLNVFIKPTIIE